MAPLPGDIFLRLPPSAAALLLSAIFGLTNGHDLPRETKAVGRHDPDAVPFPPAPTVAPWFAFNFSRREDNTICGYIGGNPSLPATCSPGSHCALDAANLVVGCCPNGYPCTTGFFTSCVDWRNGPQTEINPYIFTCQGTNVCYKNNFASGYFQYGCGTTADLGTTVEMSAHGASAALSIKTTTMRLTAAPITLSTPVAIGSSPPTSRASPTKSSSTGKNSTDGGPSKSGPGPTSTVSPSHTPTATPILPPSSTSSTAGNPPKTTRSSSQSSSTISTTKSRSSSTKSHKTSTTWKTVTHSTPSTSKTASPSATSTDDDPPSSQTASTSPPSSTPTDGAGSIKKSQTGAIVGGVVGGAAGLISLVALVFFCLRRGQNRNGRTGPGPAPEEPPMTQYSG
ncbi:hypothetical protein F5Y17DRAFT_291591 [Xylariaceae sp. FL0594]|nr:hypothetical protein F5Y17DRAFT_291591 [Xylariaceae sp. FL0594]